MISLTRVAMQFDDVQVADLTTTLEQELQSLTDRVRGKKNIAVAVGSRGISDIVPVTAITVRFLENLGAHPFIVPAMGSHGGATAQGQKDILAQYGITEESTGAPVRSSMEAIELPRDDNPCQVFMDKLAYESDGIILINRIKPHTDFHGPYESGLVKMAVVGLGKHTQAMAIHSHGVYGLKELIPPTAVQIMKTGRILGGIGIVENAYDHTMLVRALTAEEIIHEEPGLLHTARENMPRLPVEDIDILIVDRLGKDISGVGIDSNIIGRMGIRGEKEPHRPRVKSIVVCSLTDGSHGNALGIGLADVITKRLYDRIDFPAMYQNVYTSTFLERAKIPIVADSDLHAFQYALRSTGPAPPAQKRIVRIRDTLHLGTVYVSPPVLAELSEGAQIEQGAVMQFDEHDTLVPF